MNEDLLGKSLEDIPTPAFLVDREIVQKNCAFMLDVAKKYNVSLRPHMKTHKTIEGAILQTGGSKRKIVVSTLAEVEFYAANQFDDILYGYPLTPEKISRCQQISDTISQFHVMVDNSVIIECLAKRPANKSWSIFIEVDCGYHRTGVVWDSEDLVKMAQTIQDCAHLNLMGLYTHCGNSYFATNAGSSAAAVAMSAIGRITTAAERLKTAGIACPTFGVGSTPSCSSTDVTDWHKINEIHPGNYIFYDASQYKMGSCTIDQIACTVATRVIGHYPSRNELALDAGFAALTQQGTGMCDSGCVLFDYPDLKYVSSSQEIGKVSTISGAPIDYEKHPIGSLMILYPWHSCATAAQYPRYVVVEGDRIVDVWNPTRGW